MPLQLYDLPFDMLEMIGKFYDDLAQRDAASTLQATLERHVVTRCDDPPTIVLDCTRATKRKHKHIM